MKTFEQAYLSKFEAMLGEFTDKPINISNDIQYLPLETDPNELAVIIRTGPGTKASKAGYDLTTTTFYVNIIMDANDVQPVLGALASLTLIYNGEPDSLTIPVYNPKTGKLTDTTFYFKAVFSTAFIPGQAFNLRTRKATISAIDITMSITVGYSSTAAIFPDKYVLSIAGIDYPVNFSRVELSSAPAYEPESNNHESGYLKQYLLNNVLSYNFTILKQSNDALHTLLGSEFFKEDKDEFLSGKELKLKKGELTVNINTYAISEIYENGATVILLTLTR